MLSDTPVKDRSANVYATKIVAQATPSEDTAPAVINPEISSNATITIYNQLGATVLNKRVPDSGMMYIQTPNNWAEGVYYYTVESSTSTYTGKLVKL